MYYHGIKQDSWINEDEIADVTNIVGSSKVTRMGRIFSPEISPPTTTTTPVRVTAVKPVADTRGKEKMNEPSRTEAPTKDITIEDPSAQEMEKVLKIIKKSDYKIVEQLRQTPSKISMLSLLLCSEEHAQALINS